MEAGITFEQPRPQEAHLRGSDIAADVAFASELYASGGPMPDDYSAFEEWLDGLFVRYDAGLLDDASINTIRHAMPRAWTPETSQGRAYLKLRGYAGDFEIIDWIYQQRTTRVPELVRWDAYFHQSSAPTAVRNRKDFFKGALRERLERHSGPEPLRVLDLASGPCRDVSELFQEDPDANVELTCVDQDTNAIEFAKQLCAPYLDRITFVQKNVFRYRTKERFDWIWSAGLFDYLSDSYFCRLLERMGGLAAPGGQIVVGNFSINNPSLSYMRFGEWHLIHRSEEQLRSLARQCGFGEGQVRVLQEPLGVNLFLCIDCD